MKRLLSEIRRRRVIGTSALYLAGAWFLLQVFDTVFPILELPEWAMQVAFFVMLGGFPVVVALSWVFDINLSRTDSVESDAAPAMAPGEERPSAPGSAVPVAPAPPGSIAVLPFQNIGANPDIEYFSDGLTEELLHLLSTVPDIRVAARTSCFTYKNRNVDIRTIGAQLGVRNVLEGSVRWAGNRLRVTAQLIEARSGYHLMSRTFDAMLEDVFSLQGDIAEAIVDVLRDALGEHSGAKLPSAEQPTANLQAYQLYLRGRHRWQRRGAEEIKAAIALFQEALALDPNFARAKSALAAAHAVTHEYTGESRAQSFDLARKLANEAVALDRQLAEPRAVLGYMHLREWQWAESEHQLMRALELDPNDALTHQWYANVLNDLGRQKDALAEAAKAYELDRVSPMANNVLAITYTLQGRDEQALKHTRIALEFGVGGIVPAYVNYLAALRAERWSSAIDGWREAMTSAGRDSAWVEPVVAAIADPVEREAALAAVSDALARNAVAPNVAFLQYILMGSADACFEIAQTLLEGQRLNHAWLMLPEAAPLREDLRFDALATRIGLTQYWAESGGRPPLPTAVPRGENRLAG